MRDSNIVVVKWRENSDTPNQMRTNGYDFRSHEGRHAFLRFVSWAMNQDYELIVSPGMIVESKADTQR